MCINNKYYPTILTSENIEILKKNAKKIQERHKKEAIIANQKRETFKKLNKIDDCLICCNPTTESDQLECGHYFHADCLKKSQKHTNKLFCNCPICKHELKDIDIDFDLTIFENMTLSLTSVQLDGNLRIGIYDKNSKDSNPWILPRNETKIFNHILDIFKRQQSI